MKKIIIVIMLCSVLLFGCADDSNDAENRKSSFITIEDRNFWRIVYHKKTKVMYTMSTGAYNYGNFTLLVNPDGSPMIYEEGEKETKIMTKEEVIQLLITLKKQSCIGGNGTFVADIKPSSFVFVINSAIEALRKETQWIPVSERLPEKSDLYLICFNDGESELSYFDGYSFDYTGVIAWIPIPEPYKEG